MSDGHVHTKFLSQNLLEHHKSANADALGDMITQAIINIRLCCVMSPISQVRANNVIVMYTRMPSVPQNQTTDEYDIF